MATLFVLTTFKRNSDLGRHGTGRAIICGSDADMSAVGSKLSMCEDGKRGIDVFKRTLYNDRQSESYSSDSQARKRDLHHGTKPSRGRTSTRRDWMYQWRSQYSCQVERRGLGW